MLVIDFSGTVRLGCGLISVLLRCTQKAAETEHALVLCGLTSLQHAVLEYVRLDMYWSIFPTCDQAIEFSQGRS